MQDLKFEDQENAKTTEMRRIAALKSTLLFSALMLPMLTAWAVSQPLATISDLPGDDYGDGTLTYPQRADFQAGDLDLLQLKINRDEEGFWFEAMFRNPIRDPGGVTNAVSAEPLANFARKSFYQFNIDVYVDTDRANGSGNTFTLPGRQVRIGPGYAWERVVILTPRPELMRQQLLGVLTEQFPDRSKTVDDGVDRLCIYQRGSGAGQVDSLSCPPVLSGSDGTDWAVTALNHDQHHSRLVSLPQQSTARGSVGSHAACGRSPKDTFGYSGAIPVSWMLGSSAEQQVRQLAKAIFSVSHGDTCGQRTNIRGGASIAEQSLPARSLQNQQCHSVICFSRKFRCCDFQKQAPQR